MQRRSGWKIKLGLFAFSMLSLAACSQNIETISPATLTPSLSTPGGTQITAVPDVLPSSTQSMATPIPFSYGTPTPIFTPSPGVDAYRLAEWSEERALGLVKLAEEYSFANNVPMPVGEKRFNYQLDQSAVKLAAQEALYRYPESFHRENLEWRIALADTIMDSPDSDAWILEAIEDALNEEGFTPGTLDQKLNPYGFRVGHWQATPNLFGDGQPADVLWITRLDNGSTGLYTGLHQNDQGKYSLSKIYASWDFNFGYDEPVRIEDHTGDGLPEVILTAGYHNGSFCGYELAIFQWQNDRFADLSQGQFTFEVCSAFTEESWIYVNSTGQPGESIEIKRAADLLGQVIRHERFDLNGKQYKLTESWLEVPERLDPDTASWVMYAMNEEDYQSVIDKIEEFLTNQHQVEVMKLERGKSFPDYLRFQLGLAYAFQSKKEEARSVFEEIIQAPLNPANLTIANAAQAYLEDYAGDADLYSACQSALQVMETSLGGQTLWAVPRSFEQLEQAWGYKPADSEDSLALCSLSTAFHRIVTQINSGQFSQAPEILQNAGILLHPAAEVDLDRDGQTEWVLEIDTTGSDAPVDIWILLNTKEGVSALPLVPWNRKKFDLPLQAAASSHLTVDTVLSPEGHTIGFIQAGDRLYAFHLNSDERTITRVLWETGNVDSYTTDSQNNSLELEVTVTTDNCQNCKDVYVWTDGLFNWSLPDEPNKAERIEAENSLLTLWKPQEAIPLLQEVIDNHRSPRVMYLLGLAHELMSNDQKAVQVYWEIWHNYPESVYARLAQAKLELIK